MRTLKDIARDIRANWKAISNSAAKDALRCMESMGAITEPFGLDPNGNAVVTVFLGNSMGWRGEIARRIKKELQEMCGHPRP